MVFTIYKVSCHPQRMSKCRKPLTGKILVPKSAGCSCQLPPPDSLIITYSRLFFYFTRCVIFVKSINGTVGCLNVNSYIQIEWLGYSRNSTASPSDQNALQCPAQNASTSMQYQSSEQPPALFSLTPLPFFRLLPPTLPPLQHP